MEMHQLNDFEYFSLCSPLRETVSIQKSNNIKLYFSKYKKKIFVTFLLTIMILVFIYFSKSISFSKRQKSEKIKRSINLNDLKEDENIKTFKTDIEVIPQKRHSNQHPNHKYTEKELENDPQTLMRRLNAREGWSSKPFDSKINKQFGLSQDLISKSELDVHKPKEQGKFINELLTDLDSSVLLKGVYVKSDSKTDVPENQLDGKYSYSNEINNLMLNNFNGGEEGKNLLLGSPKFTSKGAPFQHPIGGRGRLRQKITSENFRLNHILKNHPITLYLEFYPMKDLKRKFKPNSNVFKHSGNKFHTSEINYSFNVENIIPPQDKRNRMVMKLNLYPKESNLSKHHISKQRRISKSKYNTKADRKSFGWFFKQKKKNNPKECSIMGIHPHGKRIRARWKNARGEWIHADHVEVKTLKKDKIPTRKYE